MTNELSRICAICGRVLNYVHLKGSTDPSDPKSHYEHSIDQKYDHPAMPVKPEDAYVINTKCDFCFQDNPQYVLPAKSFEMYGEPNLGSVTDWACCESCAYLIDRNRWNSLTDRAAAAYIERHGDPAPLDIRQLLNNLYRRLRANVSGPVRHIGPTSQTSRST